LNIEQLDSRSWTHFVSIYTGKRPRNNKDSNAPVQLPLAPFFME